MKESEIIATLNRCSTRITTGVLWRLDNLAKKLSELDNSLVGEAYNAASTLRDINISLQETRRRIENEGAKK